MAEVQGGGGSQAPRRNVPLLVGGMLAFVVGLGLLAFGAWPLGYTLELLQGPGEDPEAVQRDTDAMIEEVKARAWADVVGFVLVVGGTVLMPLSRPRQRTVDEVVEESLRRRLGAEGGGGMGTAVARSCAACSAVVPAGSPTCPAGHVQP